MDEDIIICECCLREVESVHDLDDDGCCDECRPEEYTTCVSCGCECYADNVDAEGICHICNAILKR